MRALFSGRRAAAIILVSHFAIALDAPAAELTLARAETLALERAPSLARLQSNVAAASERVAYAGQLPDPALTLGAINVPTDSLSLTEDDMTMVGIGLRQAFPPGDARAQRTRAASAGVEREAARLEAGRRRLLREVRAAWLEVYAAETSLRLVDELRRLARRDLESAEGRYRAAQDAQRAVLRARSALARVNEREPMFRAQAKRARAVLARWLGDAADEPVPAALPPLGVGTPGFDPDNHPEMRMAVAEIEAMRSEAGMARAEYRPGYMVDVMYGVRQDRPDMITAQVSLDLPIFRAKRQDPRLSERVQLERAAELEAEDKRRELRAMHAAVRVEHEEHGERLRIFENELLPALKREASVTAAGFAREQAELRDARMRELDARLELVRLRVDHARTQAELLYLTGE